MRLFLDSSALVKRYLEEPGREAVLARCAQASEILISVLAVPEAASALNRYRHLVGLSDAEYADLKQELLDDAVRASVIGLSPPVVARTIACLERAPVRTSDAIHVASALECGADRFLSGDKRQCKAARALGLRVEEVG